MNKEQAFNVLVNHTNGLLKQGKIETIQDAGLLATALEVVRIELFPKTPVDSPETQDN